MSIVDLFLQIWSLFLGIVAAGIGVYGYVKHGNQKNPNNDAYRSSRNNGSPQKSQTEVDNRANQKNPNNSAYHSSRAHHQSSSANNRANQMNPNNSAYHSSRGRK